MAIRDWPADERPRERLLKHGAQQLSATELLAIFLRTGVAGKSAVELARELLHKFGGLRPLLAATQQEFCGEKGLGSAKYAQLQAALEMARRYLAEELPERVTLKDPQSVRRYLSAELRDRDRELFGILFLDSQHRVLGFEVLSEGSLATASVYPREIVKRVLALSAGAVILAHNHPSGVAEPSDADRRLTSRLKDALALIDVRVLDHFVVGETIVSFAERGWL